MKNPLSRSLPLFVVASVLVLGACSESASHRALSTAVDLDGRALALQAMPAPPDIRRLGAFGDGGSHPLTEAELAQWAPKWSGKYAVGDQWDTIALQEAIYLASPGDTVVVPPGTYQFFRAGGAFHLKSGVNIQGAGAVFVAHPGASGTYDLKDRSPSPKPLQNIAIRGITFKGVFLRLQSFVPAFSTGHILFEDCTFINGEPNQIQLAYVSDVRFNNCTFRRDDKSPGRSIVIYISRRVTVSNSSWLGHFVTAINASGIGAGSSLNDNNRTTAVEITGNRIVRTPGSYAEDHGIYAWGMKGLNITGNEISGWSLSSAGGAIKVRNGEDVLIRGNILRNSGIMLYTYRNRSSNPHFPQYLRNVVVESNYIHQRGSVASCEGNGNNATLRPGITYWRELPNGDQNTERAIQIRFNVIEEGSIAIHNPAQGPQFRLTANRASFFTAFPEGTAHSFNRSENPGLHAALKDVCRGL